MALQLSTMVHQLANRERKLGLTNTSIPIALQQTLKQVITNCTPFTANNDKLPPAHSSQVAPSRAAYFLSGSIRTQSRNVRAWAFLGILTELLQRSKGTGYS